MTKLILKILSNIFEIRHASYTREKLGRVIKMTIQKKIGGF